jgi:hypothetical protein
MSHTDYRTLLDRGRKAGLRTSELYVAMSIRPPEASGYANGQSDGNGFVPGLGQNGRPVYRPLAGRKLS